MATRMQQRRGTAEQWNLANPVLAAGEIGWASDENKFKIGDGVNTWSNLSYFVSVDDLEVSIDDFVPLASVGQPDGVASLDSTGKLPASQLPDVQEITEDLVNGVLVAGNGITKTYDDNAGTLTIAADTSVLATKAELAEVSQDSVNDAIVAGTGITKTYNDNANTITIAADTDVLATKTYVDTEIGNIDLSTKQDVVSGVSSTEIGYLDGVTSSIQTQLDGKAASSHTHAISDVTNLQTSLNAKLDLAGGTMTGNLTLSGNPTQANHAATKAYADSITEGLHIHASVVALASSNIALPTAPATIDGVTLNLNDRVLLTAQTNPAENGIYVVINGDLARAADYNTAVEIQAGDFVFVSGGTQYNSTSWVQENSVTTLGTDPIVWSQFAGIGTITAGTGIEVTGSQVAVDTDTIATRSYVDAEIGGIDLPDTLNDLTDVVITSVANGQILSYNGTNWVNTVTINGGNA